MAHPYDNMPRQQPSRRRRQLQDAFYSEEALSTIFEERASGEIIALTDPHIQAIRLPDRGSHRPQRPLPGSPKTGETKRQARASVNLRVLAAVASLAGATIAARSLGIVNQIAISDHFGAGEAMDAYFAALAPPTFISNIVVGAIEASVIPVYTRLHKDGQEHAASVVLSTLLNAITLALGGLMALLFFFPRIAVLIFAPGISPRTAEIAVTLGPLLFPTLLLNTLVGFIISILNTTKRFALPAFTAMLSPLGTFAGTILLSNTLGVSALAIGLVAATALQFLLVSVMTRKTQLHYLPVLRFKHPDVGYIFNQFWPMLLGALVVSVNPVIDQVIASLLGSGDISTLNYALKLVNIPVTVLFLAISKAVLPYFSNQIAAGDFKGLKNSLRLFAWLVGLVTVGTSIFFIAFAPFIVTLLYRHGAFTAHDAQLTAQVLIGFSVGMPAMALGFLVPRVFSALHRNDILFHIGIYSLFINFALDILLARFLDLPGIALSTALVYGLTTALQIAVLRILLGPLGLLKPPPEMLHYLRLFLRKLFGKKSRRVGQHKNTMPGRHSTYQMRTPPPDRTRPRRDVVRSTSPGERRR
jgi:putative peptidoglycan lipid II flippase